MIQSKQSELSVRHAPQTVSCKSANSPNFKLVSGKSGCGEDTFRFILNKENLSLIRNILSLTTIKSILHRMSGFIGMIMYAIDAWKYGCTLD